MGESYQDELYQAEPEPKRGLSGWAIAGIVVLVLIVVCCICILAVFLLMGPAVGNTFSTIIEEMMTMTPGP